MTNTISIQSFFSPSCEVKIPEPTTELHKIVSRWSDSGVALPAAVIFPSTENDIIAAIRFAKEKGLRIIPGSGGHGSFVPIDSKTIYLDLKRFRTVSVDKSNDSVTIAGGSLAADVLKACVAEGYYTFFPNSNAVGMIGAFLGGASSAFNGIHGFGIDNVLTIRLLTASGSVLTLTPSSTGEEANLFNTICGAGHGLGVITSLTLRAFPISGLHLTDNKIWVRKIIFPPTAIATAAELYTQLQRPAGPLTPVIGFARAPPTSPAKGAPMILLNLAYLGPAEEAEQAAAAALAPEVVDKAISAETLAVPFANMNDGAEAFNGHGGLKEMYTAMLESVSATSLTRAFDRWKKFGDEVEDARPRSYTIVASWNTQALLANATAGADGIDKKFYRSRGRGLLMQSTAWYEKPKTKAAADEYGRETLEIFREEDTKNQLAPASFANNIRFGQDMEEVYSKDMIGELKRMRQLWDPEGVFWSPVGDGRFR
ncbi:FAD-binding domain-containing protein [Glonium stellatum]|uniref:FAD-binding domain-containing protein n=1 Tax=Glonium stellatum TaxID=574774 RepID=A0A8E2JZ78_9PEZI|nr:FAD-binding domain-containing protein [Glonium stellatum]